MKITINNEEVLCNKDFTINEEMLNTSSVILNNVYPATWEQDKDYVSRFYYPKDYSKCKIFDEIVHPTTRQDIEGTNLSINVDTTKQYQVQTLKGQTTQTGTPTPTTPQPINITTGRQVVSVAGKNLFDKNNLQELKGYFSASQTTIASNAVNYTFYISCQPNTTYTITITSGTGTFNFGYTETLPAINTQVYGITTTKTLTTGANGHYLVCRYYHSNNATKTKQEILDSIQIEKGNTPSTYEEYKGNDYEINLGKNLWNTDFERAEYNSSGVKVSTNVWLVNTTKINVIPNTTYTISQTEYPIQYRIICFNGTTYLSQFSSSQNTTTGLSSYTFTTPNNCNGIYIQFRSTIERIATGTYTVEIGDITNAQLEKGSQASSFSPYKTPIYLGEMRNTNNVVIAKDCIFRNTTENPLYDSNLEEGQWYIHKEIGRYDFTGTETWTRNNYGTNSWYITNLVNVMYIDTIKTIMSNIFYGLSNSERASSYTNKIYVDQWNNTTIRDTTLTTNAEVQNATKGNYIYYVLNTPTNTLIEDEELINQLNSIELLDGLNNVSITSPYLPFIMSLMYNYQEGYTEEELYFCGIVKNTGEISLNPRHPHYCNIQVLDFKDFLSQGETLDFVITEKTIGEAIDQVIGTIAPYGFIKGNILLDDVDELMGTYSTKDKTAYDVFNYIADITQSRWTTRMVDENTIAIDYFDPNKLPLGEQIEYNQTWFRNHKIDDLSYSYSSNDYRNKQVMLSGEVYSNIETTEILVADGYQTQFNTIDKIGKVSSLLLNGTPVSIITKEEYDLGYDADFYYQPGNKYFESVNLVSTGAILTIVYYAIIEGREVILNQEEISLIEERTGRKGVVARYESRNDATTTGELQAIGQSYLEYKGIPEIKLNVSSRENTWNIGDRVYFNAPLDELKQTYMVKAKKIQRITTIDELFYQYELTSSFNMEQDINYFDNQRYKSRGNIGSGDFISRNIDIENTANVIFYDLEVQEVEITSNNTLQSELQSVLGGVE